MKGVKLSDGDNISLGPGIDMVKLMVTSAQRSLRMVAVRQV